MPNLFSNNIDLRFGTNDFTEIHFVNVDRYYLFHFSLDLKNGTEKRKTTPMMKGSSSDGAALTQKIYFSDIMRTN